MFAWTLSRGPVEVKVTSRATQRSGREVPFWRALLSVWHASVVIRHKTRLARIATNQHARFDEPASAAPDRSGARTRPMCAMLPLAAGRSLSVLRRRGPLHSPGDTRAVRSGAAVLAPRAFGRGEAAMPARPYGLTAAVRLQQPCGNARDGCSVTNGAVSQLGQRAAGARLMRQRSGGRRARVRAASGSGSGCRAPEAPGRSAASRCGRLTPAVGRPGRQRRSHTTHMPQATACQGRPPRGTAADRAHA